MTGYASCSRNLLEGSGLVSRGQGGLLGQGGLISCDVLVGCCFQEPRHNEQRGREGHRLRDCEKLKFQGISICGLQLLSCWYIVQACERQLLASET